MANIAIIGAGVVGLSTAINLRKALPTSKITIIADKFYKETTSYGAGGLFRPNAEHIRGVDDATIKRWSLLAFKHYSSLALSPEACDSGHMIMAGYVFSHKPVVDPLYKELVFSFRELTSDELQKLDVKYKYGYQVTTIVTDLVYYLPWLMRRFKEEGGIVQYKTVNNLQEFVGEYDIVANCTGFRSRDLVGDKSVYPIRGHLIQVKAPWVKNWVYTEEQAYFVPRLGGLVSLGGIRQKNNFSKERDQKDADGILQRCYDLWPNLKFNPFPKDILNDSVKLEASADNNIKIDEKEISLFDKGAPIVSEWVDLRPHRDPVRLEMETISNDKGTLKVVHNYGHGANGITLSWGSSLDAVDLIVQSLRKNKSKL